MPTIIEVNKQSVESFLGSGDCLFPYCLEQ